VHFGPVIVSVRRSVHSGWAEPQSAGANTNILLAAISCRFSTLSQGVPEGKSLFVARQPPKSPLDAPDHQPCFLVRYRAARVLRGSTQRKFAMYTFAMSDSVSHWTMQKRFLDFNALDGGLANKNPQYMLNIDRLPAEITFNNITPDLLETRQKIFDLYQKQLLRDELLSSPELREFREAPVEKAAFSDDEYIEYDRPKGISMQECHERSFVERDVSSTGSMRVPESLILLSKKR